MSKKFYIAPESEEMMLMTEGFLAASGASNIEDGDSGIILDPDGGDDDGF
jgi:hypothetical protein